MIELLPWQQSVIDHLLAAPKSTLGTNRMRNVDHGVMVNFGRRAGHTTLAKYILENFPNACVVVCSDKLPYHDLAQFPESVHSRIFVSTPQEAVGKKTIIEKAVEPLKSAEICIVDNARRFSDWELEPMRNAPWLKYVELA